MKNTVFDEAVEEEKSLQDGTPSPPKPDRDQIAARRRLMRKRPYATLILSIVFLLNANLNIIDILPDFIGYLLLARLIGTSEQIVPYLAECKSALNKLALISLLKLPGVVLMFGNISSGRDVITLFTLAFSTLEIIFTLPALTNGFSALYCLGQRRNESEVLISPFTVCGKRMRPDDLRLIALVFAIGKPVLSFLPELCNLTSANAELMSKARALYPWLFLLCFISVSALGIFLLVSAVSYIKSIKASKGILDGIVALAGNERLSAIGKNARMRHYKDTVMILMYSALLSFDIRVDSYGDVLVLPHFLYGIVITVVAFRLSQTLFMRRISTAVCGLYTLLGGAGYALSIYFNDNFAYRDLKVNELARQAYKRLIYATVAETVVYLAVCVVLGIALYKFAHAHTALSEQDAAFSRQDAMHHRHNKRRCIALFVIAALSALLKLVKIISDGNVQMIITGADVVTASSLPWMGLVSTASSILFFAYSWHFLTDVRDDIELKYREEIHA